MQIDHCAGAAASSATVAPVPGIAVPERITVTAAAADGTAVRIEAAWNAATGRYGCGAVTVEAAPESTLGPEVLRGLPLARLLADGAAQVLEPLWPEPAPIDVRSASVEAKVEAVTAWYTRGLAFGQGPQQAVSQGMGLPTPTAAKLITKARDRGVLHLVDPRSRPRS